MAKFARPTTRAIPQMPAGMTLNRSGFAALSMPVKERLVSTVLTSFINEDKYYGDTTSQLVADCRELLRTEPEFVGKLAVYARNVFNLRSVAHVLAAELSHAVHGSQYVKYVIRDVCLRPDDMVEIVAYTMKTWGRTIPKAMKRGIGLAFTNFNAYSLAKYNHNDAHPSLIDVERLCHPEAAGKDQNEIFKQLRQNTLPTPVTWETELSAKGNTKAVWESLIDRKAIGYMAMLRNLRNLINAGISEDHMRSVIGYLTNEKAVKNSRVLPFRFLSAWRNLPSTAPSDLFDALERACQMSVSNMEKIEGKTLVAIDRSGSMSSPVSQKSQISCCNAAAMLGIMVYRLCDNATVVTFDDRLDRLSLTKDQPIIQTAQGISPRGGTSMNLPFEFAMKAMDKFDRIIMLSDNENNGHSELIQRWADDYRRQKNANLWVHAIDMAGYGTQQFSGNQTSITSGWSEKVLQFIKMTEAGIGSLISTIDKIQIGRKINSEEDEEE